MFIKLGRNIQSKDEIELAVYKAFRVFLLAVRFFKLRLAVLPSELLNGFSLIHIGIYGAHKQAHNKEKNKGFTVELESGEI